MIKHTWNQLSEATKRKFGRNDFKILSKKEQEFLSMGATMFSGAGPVIEPKNLHQLTPKGLSITLKKMEKEKRNLDSEGKKLLQSVTKKLSSITEQYDFGQFSQYATSGLGHEEDEEEKRRKRLEKIQQRMDDMKPVELSPDQIRPMETGQPGAMSIEPTWQQLAQMAPKSERDKRGGEFGGDEVITHEKPKAPDMSAQPGMPMPKKRMQQGQPPSPVPPPPQQQQKYQQQPQGNPKMKELVDMVRNDPGKMNYLEGLMGKEKLQSILAKMENMSPEKESQAFKAAGMMQKSGGMPQGMTPDKLKQLMQDPEKKKKLQAMMGGQGGMPQGGPPQGGQGGMPKGLMQQDPAAKAKAEAEKERLAKQGPRDMGVSKTFADRMGIKPITRLAVQKHEDDDEDEKMKPSGPPPGPQQQAQQPGAPRAGGPQSPTPTLDGRPIVDPENTEKQKPTPGTTPESQEFLKKYEPMLKSLLQKIVDEEEEKFQTNEFGSLGIREQATNVVGDGMSPIEGEGHFAGYDPHLFRRKKKKGDCGCKKCKCKNNRQ